MHFTCFHICEQFAIVNGSVHSGANPRIRVDSIWVASCDVSRLQHDYYQTGRLVCQIIGAPLPRTIAERRELSLAICLLQVGRVSCYVPSPCVLGVTCAKHQLCPIGLCAHARVDYTICTIQRVFIESVFLISTFTVRLIQYRTYYSEVTFLNFYLH